MIGAGWEYACLHKVIGVGIIVYLIEKTKKDNEEKAKSKVDEMCKKLLVNLIIEDFTISKI